MGCNKGMFYRVCCKSECEYNEECVISCKKTFENCVYYRDWKGVCIDKDKIYAKELENSIK